MEAIVFVAVWLCAGAAGSWLSMEFNMRRNGQDVDVGDLMFLALMAALGGVVNLLFGMIFACHFYVSRSLVNTDRVIFRRK